MSAPLENARALFTRASHDLINAGLAVGDERILDTVCFHAQQAVEKDLKALLAAMDSPYPRTHDLRLLHDLVVPHYPDLADLAGDAVALTAYAVELRYGGLPDPDDDEARWALELATQIHARTGAILDAIEGSDASSPSPEDAA